MKVKIKNKGNQETYNLIDSWSDVNLERWQKFMSLGKESKAKEAEETITAMSDIPKKLVNALSIKDISIITEKVAQLQSKQSTVLKKIIEIEGVEYAMHPDLSELTLGEYADLETMIKEGFEDNMPEIMAILFRPVVEKLGDAYVIEAYDGNITIRTEIMKKMKAEQVQNALVFFWNFGKILWKIMPLSLMQESQEMMETFQTGTSIRDGDGSV